MGRISHGIDTYNLSDTGDVVCTISTYVGQATASGPKVLEVFAVDMGGGKSSSNITTNISPTITCTHGGHPVIGTIEASIYRKNGFQDTSKYILRKVKSMKQPIQILEEKIAGGTNVLDILNSTQNLLNIVNSGEMSIDEAIKAIDEIRKNLTQRQGDQMKDKDIKTSEEVNESDEVCVVRRLAPTETSRLQGFPDDYTKIDGSETADAPQFKAHGNSWATPCANFISTRTDMEIRRLGHNGQIRYATCCSGIEAQSVAVEHLDWKGLFFSEIEAFPCRVLEKHYPSIPNLGDMTQIRYYGDIKIISNKPEEGYECPREFVQAKPYTIPFEKGELEVFSGGTPCQSVSVAGKREGMAEGSGTRSSLAFHFQRIIDETRPMFTIWENVPGAFSSNGGADFIWFVNRCAESGYSMAWRVLDAQYTMTEEFPRAVPQRRRRIWLVGYRGNDWRIPARIVFELEKNLTDNPPERIPGKGFKILNPDFQAPEGDEDTASQTDEGLFGFSVEVDDGSKSLSKVSQMIDFSEMPAESDFSKVSMADVYAFAKKIGEPGYIGSVFRKDKKKKVKKVDDSFDLFSMMNGEEPPAEEVKADPEEDEDWVGAEKITPDILENIGNSGILANGRICTLNCHEWTGGIQLTPKTYNAWEELVKAKEWVKANQLLPIAYDETVCGLSDVLLDDPDEKYNLSWRACFGILKRAETRGKELPAALEIALISTIRENAGIVKWVALNGRDNKKKETDLSEKESAEMCFKRFIAPVMEFDAVEATPPKGKAIDESEEEETQEEEDEFLEQNENLGEEDGEESYWGGTDRQKDKVNQKTMIPDMPNGCCNESGGETAPTIVASQFKGPRNTQDGSVVAVKKGERFSEE